ncbi:MAG: hypothetical protein JSU96_12535 [Acidobacteriota bacterium]|nr:MAG: hypothetical protein JSU96_12535 [Acidobacteriota bacterium]
MLDKIFPNLPDEARIWVHGFKESLSAQQAELLDRQLKMFIPNWQTHGRKVTADFLILHDRFVITAAHCAGGISGCSIDSFFRTFKQLRDEAELDGLDGSLIYYRDKEGTLQATDNLSFYEVIDSGQITPETIVFDTLIETLGELRAGKLEVPYRSAWHSRSFPLPSPELSQT